MDIRANEERKRINYLSAEISALYHEAATKAGLSDSALEILYVLCEEGNRCPQKTIYQSTGSSRSTINSAIRRLEQAGILYLEAGDGRNTLVCLTDQGQQLMEKTAQPLQELENEIFSEWTEAEQLHYLQLTEKYLSAFRQKLPRLYQGD